MNLVISQRASSQLLPITYLGLDVLGLVLPVVGLRTHLQFLDEMLLHIFVYRKQSHPELAKLTDSQEYRN